jgi:hypothetical protein
MKTLLLIWVIVLAFSLPHSFIFTAFYFFCAFLLIALLFFIGAFIVGAVYAWRKFRRTH